MKSKHVLVSLHDSGKHAHTKIICAGMMMSVRGCLYSETLIAGGRDMRQGGMLIRARSPCQADVVSTVQLHVTC